MAVDVGTLQAVLKLRDELSPVIKSAESNVGRSASGMLKSFDSLAQGGLAGLAIGAGMAVATKAIESLGAAVMSTVRAVGELAARGEYISQKAYITGFSAESVQALERLAENAGMSGEAVFMAVSRMARAAEGSGVAFKKLGIDASRFKELAPTEQFELVAKKIAAIESPTERAAAAIGVFGRSGAQLLPVLRDVAQGADALKVSLSDQQVAALNSLDASIDNTSGAWVDLKEQMTAILATTPELITGLADVASVLNRIAAGAKQAGPELSQMLSIMIRLVDRAGALDQLKIMGILFGGSGAPKPLDESTADQWYRIADGMISAEEAAELLEKQIEETKQQLKDDSASQKAAEAAKKFASELLRQEYALKGQAIQLGFATDELNRYFSVTVPGAESLPDLTQAVLDLNAALGAGPEIDPAVIEGAIAESVRVAGEAWKKTPLGKPLMDSLTESLEQLPSVIVGAIQGGGDVFKAVFATLGGDLGEALGKKLAASIGGTFGKLVGSLAGPLGALAGDLLGGLFDKLFGGGKQKEVNKLRDAFISASGGLEALKKKAAEAGVSLTRLFAAKDSAKGVQAAIDEITKKLGLWDEAHESVTEAAERYGLTIEELGPKFQQQKLDEMVGQLLQDYELLKASGADMNAVITKMAPSFNEYVQTALAAGQSLPENMKPIIDSLISQGLLLDANGEAYKTAEEAGITYTKTLSQGLMEVVEAIKLLVATLTGVSVPPIHVPIVYDDPGYGGNPANEYGPEGYASGSDWRDFGSGRLAMLHGIERVQTPAQAAAEASGGKALAAEVAGLRKDLAGLANLDRTLTRAFRDAMLLV